MKKFNLVLVAMVVGLFLTFPPLSFAQNKPNAAQQREIDAKKRFDSGVSKADYVIKNKSALSEKEKAAQILEAIKEFDKAIELKPDFAEAYYQRVRTRLLFGFPKQLSKQVVSAMLQALLKDLDKAIELKPKYAEAYSLRAFLLHSDEAEAVGLDDLDSAMKDCEKSISLNPKLGEGYSVRGSIKQKQQKLREALADYDKAVQFISSVTAPYLLYYNRGVIKDSLKDYRGAIQEYTKAISLEINYAPSYLNRGTAKFYLKDISACDDWSKACSLGNDIGCNNVAQFCQR